MRILLLLCFFAFPVVAHADPITFNYEGFHFRGGSGIITAGSFIFGSAVIDFQGAGSYTATAWSIGITTSDGPVTITSQTPNLIASRADFSLDELGNISTWILHASANVYGTPDSYPEFISTFWPSLSQSEDRAEIDADMYLCTVGACTHQQIIEWFSPPWTRADVQEVPESSSIALLLVGAVVMGLDALIRGVKHRVDTNLVSTRKASRRKVSDK